MQVKKGFESIEWDKEKSAVVITTQQSITRDEAGDIEEMEKKLKWELRGIVSEVKVLKKRAEEIKTILGKIKGEAGPIDPAL